MVSFSTAVVAATSIFATQAVAAAVPALAARGGGYPASNPVGTSCYNKWETVTNDPVVQYWYVVASNVGNDIKADRVWNHLNLNGCAPTENKYYAKSNINGAVLTFHTSEACTAARVSHALRSGSDPGVNIACAFTGKDGVDPGEAAATGGDAVLEGILEGLGAFGGGE